ncbi:response regulator [bacterium]|nr:response regulator [bacterium]
MVKVELDDEFLGLFYEITNSKPPVEPTLLDLKKQLKDIVCTFQELNKNSKKPIINKAIGENGEENLEDNAPAILIIDDLGVITYQLKVLLSQFKLEVDCSQEIYDAVSKYKKRRHAYVVMDLFIPTEREGFILLTELKKLASASNSKIIIGVITASPRKEIEQQCKARGADFFLEKNNDWQSQLTNIMSEYIKENNGDEEDDW